jgi:uncharacterized coiled-coil protein SlyX
MAWPWLTIVARTIPWAELARNAPKIIAASSDLLAKRNAAAREELRVAPDEADEIELARRIRALERQNTEDARAIQQLANDVSELREGVEVLAARLRLLAWAVGAALVLALVALWLVL